MPRFITLLLAAAVVFMAGCAVQRDASLPRPLSGLEILELVSRNDDLALPVAEGVTVTDVGQFVEAPRPSGPPEDAPLCPASRYELVSHSRLVAAELLRGFGFKYVLHGLPQAGGATLGSHGAPLTLVAEHPPVLNPVSGEIVRREVLHIMGCIGHESEAVFQFTSDWELVPGAWTLRLMTNGAELAAKRFEVAAPGSQGQAVAPAPQTSIHSEDLRVQLSGKRWRAPRRAAPAQRARGRMVFVLVSSNLKKINAEKDVLAMQALGYPAELGVYVDRNKGRVWHTARLGRFATVREAEQAAKAFSRREGRQAYVVVRSPASVAAAQQPAAPPKAAPVAQSQTSETQAPTASSAAPAAMAAVTPKAAPAAKPHVPEDSTSVAPAASAAAEPSTPQAQETAVSQTLTGAYTVQVAACLERRYATHDAAQLAAKGWPATVFERTDEKGRLWHTVVLGSFATRAEAQQVAERFRQKERRQAYTLAVP